MSMDSDDYAAWLKSLKAGDEVMAVDYGYQCVRPTHKLKISSITKTGRMRVVCGDSVVYFKPNGYVYGWQSGIGTKIVQVTEELEESLRVANEEREVTRWRERIRGRLLHMRWDDVRSVTDNQLRAVEAILWPPKPTTEPTP